MAEPSERIALVSPELMMIFGTIIYGFARIEGLMIATTSVVADVDSAFVNVLMGGLGYGQKRDALYSYFELYETADGIQRPIRDFLDAIHEHQGLRNHIAHSYWVPGTRERSIKPASLRVRGGKGRVLGLDTAEKDFTLEELAAVGDKLRLVHNSLLVFLTDKGLLSNMDKNMLQTIDETSPSVGATDK
jgi:hypothetical protein